MAVPSTHLYFIGAEGVDFVKVGRSKDPEARLRQLRTSSPYKLRLLKTYEGAGMLEPYVLAALRLCGEIRGEWFLASHMDFDDVVEVARQNFLQTPAVHGEPSSPAPRGFGTAVAQARKALGLKQQDVQRLAGISQKYLSRIENGRADPGWSVVQRLARTLQMNLDVLLQEETV